MMDPIRLYDGAIHLYAGDCREVLRTLPAESVHCVVTSPPYWGLRDYGMPPRVWGGDPGCAHEWGDERVKRFAPSRPDHSGTVMRGTYGEQPAARAAGVTASTGAFCGSCDAWRGSLGIEPTPGLYVDHLIEVFREVWRVLRADGTLWLNLGDSYSRAPDKGGAGPNGAHDFIPHYGDARRIMSESKGSSDGAVGRADRAPVRVGGEGLKAKDLVGIPWSVAKALQAPHYTGRIQRERDRVWLAAMIDAEGTICGFDHNRADGGGHRSGVHITITNSSTALLDEAARIWPTSRSEHERPGPGHLGTLQTYRWIVHGIENKLMALRELYPYLISKRQQGVIAYTLLLLMADAKRLGHSSQKDAVIAKRAVLTGLMSDLNHQRPVVLPDWLTEPPPLYEPGWYLRQWMPWVKRNPMPESVRDRPTSACEVVFLLSKAQRYFYDYDAVSKKLAPASLSRLEQDVASRAGSDRANGGAKTNGPMKAVRRSDKQRGHSRRHAGFNDRWDAMTKAEQGQPRAFRNTDLFYSSLMAPHGIIGDENEILAFDVTTQPYHEAHFATFPPALVEPCLLAGTSARGCCLSCGTPWARVVTRRFTPQEDVRDPRKLRKGSRKGLDASNGWGETPRGTIESTTCGWTPTCRCRGQRGQTAPAVVLDPFGGAGTVALVAHRLGRHAISIDLNPEYVAMQQRRLTAELPLFA